MAMSEHIMMNVSDADETIQEGDMVQVFLYTNRRGELTATMQMPNMTGDTFGWARVIRVDDKEGVYVILVLLLKCLSIEADMPRVTISVAEDR